MGLEIDEDRAVGLPPTLCPIVHTKRPHWGMLQQRCGTHEAQECAPTDSDPLSGGVAGTRCAAQGKACTLQMLV
jgi:hypothetical protein